MPDDVLIGIHKPDAFRRLEAVATQLKEGSEPAPITIREFLHWFNAFRRGRSLVGFIRYALSRYGLATSPDFESEYIGSSITFRLTERARGQEPGQLGALGNLAVQLEPASLSASGSLTDGNLTPPELPNRAVDNEGGTVESMPPAVAALTPDPTYRLGKLPAANNPPVRVHPDQKVNEAVTLMLSRDFSQLPVMTSERKVEGLISWKSIGSRWALGKEGELVRDLMDGAPHIASGEVSLFAALPVIAEHDYVLVRDKTQRIVGIVTAADLSEQFWILAEPYLLLGEIENHIRRLIGNKLTPDELTQAKDPSDTSRDVRSAADLTFGEYVRLLEAPERWDKLALQIDRRVFLDELRPLREIRNDVMHFDPDPLGEPQLAALRNTVKFLQALHELRG